ncbi:GNAT family N-acetyltransferase [Aquisphaera insulae]|uniref:GNAT family N-acetyltransferase n=1 Tax=Aquisphaera insulae TaxID=2712864 RepID=UPI0013EA6BB3|nr:GNAT family N-acetyltransferase [Aquisphaera insulae]
MRNVRDVTDLDLVRRVEAGWDAINVETARSQRALDPALGADWIAVGGGHAAFLGMGSFLSQAQGLALDGPVGEDEIARMEQFFLDRGTPVQVEVATLADPSFLTALCLRGYTVADQSHSLVCPLEAGGGDTRDDAETDTASLQIVPAGVGDWDTLVDVTLRCFFEDPESAPPLLREGMLAMAALPANTGWLAVVDGEPAGGGSLWIHEGLALFYTDGTLAPYRGRGIHSALLQARLDHARAAGCDLAAIVTPPGGGSQRTAQRAGFVLSHARTMMVRHADAKSDEM